MFRFIGICLLLLHYAHADVIMPSIFNSGMVLQRGIELPVWGWAEPNESVRVSFKDQVKSVTADSNGQWKVSLQPLKMSTQGQNLKISGKNNIVLKNVLVGDVWICSGQSNMEWSVSGSDQNTQNVAKSKLKNENIRLFRVPNHIQSPVPLADVQGTWTTCHDLNQIRAFSGVGFSFGHTLESELQIPIGLIDTSWGGTAIESWIAPEGYKNIGQPLKELDSNKLAGVKKNFDKIHQEIDAWKKKAALAAKVGKMIPSPNIPQFSQRAQNGIYNAMVAGLAPFGVKGAIWYQGESNRSRVYPDYFNKLKALISGWKEKFTSEKFSFYLVQIAPFDYNRGNRSANDLVLCENIWRSQYRAANEIEGCDIVPIHDTINGNIKDIHPRNKLTVGQRLAALALKHDYSKDVVSTGPVFKKVDIEGQKMKVHFNFVDQGLGTNDKKDIRGFEVSADGQTYVSASAKVEGKSVTVWNDTISSPKYVRMGWSEVAVPNLTDKNGWPVRQFTTQPAK